MSSETSEMDRRSLEELVTRYEFHPEFRDLYIEGPRDLSLFRWFIAENKTAKAKLYLVNEVSLPYEAVQAHSPNHTGNVGRLVTLAVLLGEKLPSTCDSIRCVIDRDQHDFGYSAPNTRYLRLLDVGSLEAYALRERPFRKFCELLLGKSIATGVLEALKRILHIMFVIRLVKRGTAPDAKLFDDFTKSCQMDGDIPQFDLNGFIRRIAAVSGGKLSQELLQSALASSLDAVRGADLRSIHGHDFVKLITWYARSRNVHRDVANELSIQRSMLSAIEYVDLMKEPLFAELATWAGVILSVAADV